MKKVYLELDGKKYEYSFGLGFLGECIENLKLTPDELDKKAATNPFKWLPEMMYQSILYANDIDFDKKDFIKMLDKDPKGMRKAGEFYGAFQNSLYKNIPKSENNSDNNDVKKK